MLIPETDLAYHSQESDRFSFLVKGDSLTWKDFLFLPNIQEILCISS